MGGIGEREATPIAAPVSRAAHPPLARPSLRKKNLFHVHSPFGSHTAEVLLATVARLADGSAPVLRDADEEAAARATTTAGAALEGVTSEFGRRFYDLATHRSGSHVLRALLTCLAGRDVAPPGGGGGGGRSGAPVDGATALRVARRKAGGAGRGASQGAPAMVGLPSKVGGAGDASAATPIAAAHPYLVRKLADVLLGPEYAPWLEELAYGPYAGPAVQALLRAAVGDDDLLAALIPRLLGAPLPAEGDPPPKDGSRLASIPKDTILAAARDRAGSHLLEAALGVAPRAVRVELDARALRGRLADLAAHPTANFVVQAALAAADSAPAVKGALKELGPVMGALLAGRRGGVVAALVAAAGRVPALPAEVAAAVAAGLTAARPHPAGLAAALVTLDAQEAGTAVEEVGHLSPVGCALLAALLRLPAGGGGSTPAAGVGDGPASSRGAGAAFGDALAALPPATFAAIAADAAGSRAVEALFQGPALGAKAVRAAAAKLSGRLAAVAATPGGTHAVEAAWTAAKPADREVMTAELAAATGSLGTAFRTLALLRRVGVSGGGGGAWKRAAFPVAGPPTPTPTPVADEKETVVQIEEVVAGEEAPPPGDKKKAKRTKEEKAARKKRRAERAGS